MDKIKDLIFKNTGLKLISLLIAIFLWLVSMNINNPQVTKNYTIPISVLNLSNVNDNGMVILNEAEILKTQVYIKIKATRNDMNALDESRIKATIDFSPLDITNTKNVGKSVPVNIYVSVPSISYEIVDYSPKTVDVIFDELTTKDIPIEVNKTGSAGNNYQTSDEIQVSPEFVTVKGAKTYVDSIDKAQVDVNVDNAVANINEQYEISIFDNENNNITERFSLSSKSANVNIGVSRIDSLLISTPKWEGEPQEGFEVIDISWTPKYIDVIGDETAISEISFVDLPATNVTGAKNDVVQVYDLNEILKPLGISVQEGAENKATVTVKIEEVVTKTLDIPIENVKLTNISEEKIDELSIPPFITVTVTGPESEVVDLDPATISCVADFSTYVDGDKDIEVDVSCSNVLIDVETPIRLRVLEDS